MGAATPSLGLLGIAGSLQRICGKPHSMRATFCDWHRDAEHTNQRGRRMGASNIIRAKEPLAKGRSPKQNPPGLSQEAMDPSRSALQAGFGATLPHFYQKCCSGVMFFYFFITLPARTLTFATILGKLSLQKCFTSLFGSNTPSRL